MSISKLADVNDITVDDLEEDSVGEDGAGSSEELSNLSVVETDWDSSDFNGNLVVSGVMVVAVELLSEESLDIVVIDTDWDFTDSVGSLVASYVVVAVSVVEFSKLDCEDTV